MHQSGDSPLACSASGCCPAIRRQWLRVHRTCYLVDLGNKVPKLRVSSVLHVSSYRLYLSVRADPPPFCAENSMRNQLKMEKGGET